MSPGARRAVFVDRDGVLNALAPDPDTGLPESPVAIGDVHLLPGVGNALMRLSRAGFALVCVTNQPAAAKAKVTVSELLAINDRITALLREQGVSFDDTEICLHHPEGIVPELSRACDCRKPEPGMLLQAAGHLDIDLSSSWMIGDSDSDVEAGLRVGCRTVLVEHGSSAHRRDGAHAAEATTSDLVEAVEYILSTIVDC